MASSSSCPLLLSPRKVDCLCSALGVNCFQFPFGFPNRSLLVCPDADTSSDTSNWMRRLQELHPSVLLRDLVIVGTHDAGSYTISGSRPFSAIGRTQQLDVKEQLEAGARYVDLRVAGSGATKPKLVIQHGCLPGGSFQTVVEDIHSFLFEHPGEFVVVEVTPEYGQPFGPTDKSACLAVLNDAFHDILLSVGDLRQAIDSKTLKQVVQGDKRHVAVLLHPRFYSKRNEHDGYDEGTIRNEFGFAHSGRFLRNKWHDTRNIDHLLECNLKEVQERGSDKKKWLINQLILTPGVSSAAEVLQALVGRNPLRPVSWAMRLYQDGKFDEYIRSNADEPWNLVMLDYVDLCPTAVDFLVALNFCSHLQIEAAVVEHEGRKTIVTERAKEFVKRDRVLWLTSIPRDLELLFRGGSLTMAYRLAKDGENGESMSSYYLLYIDQWDSRTPLLVSQFASNTNNATKTEVQPSLERGFVSKNGRISADRDESTLLEFLWSGNVCSFNVEL